MKDPAIKQLLTAMILITSILAGFAFNSAVDAKPVSSDTEVIITQICYDTYLSGDTNGEFIRIHNPTDGPINIGGWEITDGEGVIRFPEWANIDAGESLYLAYNATAFYDEMLQHADFEYGRDSDPTPNMAKLDFWLKLRNDGDEVILRDNKKRIVDVAVYGNSDYTGRGWNGAPIKRVKDEKGRTEGVILEREINETTGQYEDTDSCADWDGPRVYIIGQSHFPYAYFSFNGNVTLFTSPDSSFDAVTKAIDAAQKSIYINVYQFHNLYLMDHIIDAIARGVVVKIMLEGEPVTGISDTERYIAHKIVNAGGEVRFMIDDSARGIHDRYAFNHAKYAIIDNQTTIVMSENWKNTGVPFNNTTGNRGWGVIVNNRNVSNYFIRVFFEDWKPASRDSFPFTPDDPIYGNKYGAPPRDFVPDRTIPVGNYSHPFHGKLVSGNFNISPVLAPDTSLMRTKSVIGMISEAQKSVYVEQSYICKDWGRYANPTPNPFLEAVIDAARRGCEVKVLLDSRYDRACSEETIDYLRAIAKDENLAIEARLIDNDAIGLNKTHNKGVIVDRSKVLISSINWGENSARYNREAGLIITNKDVAKFYTDVFLYDWNNSPPPPVIFDTGPSENPYPSISGTFIGTIIPSTNIDASKLYTYPCEGTGGHTEYVRIWNSTWHATAYWHGYVGDWHNISINAVLMAGQIYHYAIRTGSYPQIIHEHSFNATGGKITCTKFTDANGRVYYDMIPAIRLYA